MDGYTDLASFGPLGRLGAIRDKVKARSEYHNADPFGSGAIWQGPWHHPGTIGIA